MAIALHYAARSDVGLVRQENQDSGYAGPHLLVVADGMGGHAAGDVASSIAIGEMVGLDAESPGADQALDRLAEALRSANTELRNAVERQQELKGMGTTVTALLRTGNKIAVAHIGDSRAYLLRDGALTQITHDHSFVQSLVDEGRITEAEAEGRDQVFKDFGAEWRNAGCSMCLGMNPDQLAPQERSASTSNRNFEGRQGKGGRTHLVSPLVAAATAVRGTLSSPADLVDSIQEA